MTKKEMINVLSDRLGFTAKDTQRCVEATVEMIVGEVEGNGYINVAGLGSFQVVKRSATKKRNPRTGEQIDVPAKQAIKFKPSKFFKAVVQ